MKTPVEISRTQHLKGIHRWEGGSPKFFCPPGVGRKTADTNMLAYGKAESKPRQEINNTFIYLYLRGYVGVVIRFKLS
jgi:hypothetical protein